MSNSGHCFTADIISTLLFEDAFQGGEFKHKSRHLLTQVSTLRKRLLKSHCWASLPVPIPHVLLLGKCLLQPLPMDPF
jgi:hypothetical protein